MVKIIDKYMEWIMKECPEDYMCEDDLITLHSFGHRHDEFQKYIEANQ